MKKYITRLYNFHYGVLKWRFLLERFVYYCFSNKTSQTINLSINFVFVHFCLFLQNSNSFQSLFVGSRPPFIVVLYLLKYIFCLFFCSVKQFICKSPNPPSSVYYFYIYYSNVVVAHVRRIACNAYVKKKKTLNVKLLARGE